MSLPNAFGSWDFFVKKNVGIFGLLFANMPDELIYLGSLLFGLLSPSREAKSTSYACKPRHALINISSVKVSLKIGPYSRLGVFLAHINCNKCH